MSKVYFASLRLTGGECIADKLKRLIRAAGIGKIDFRQKFVAVKVHFGEEGNLAFLRADYARAVIEVIRSLGGKPFVTDANTMYVGSRRNALDHLDTAYRHGYNPLSLAGCHAIIADGLKGTDDVLVPIDGEFVKTAKIARAIMDADVLVSLTHFKGHEGTGFGGTLKNIGMGSGSARGKAEMHESEKPAADRELCTACGICRDNCAHQAIGIEDFAHVNYDRCVGCGRCIGVCPTKAMRPIAENGCEMLARKVAEYTYAVCRGRPSFHVSLIVDVSPFCDCYGVSDAPVIPDVGMLASFDPVALDKACADLANRQHAIADSYLGEKTPSGDHFRTMHPDTNWEAGIEQAEKVGLGSAKYELIDIG